MGTACHWTPVQIADQLTVSIAMRREIRREERNRSEGARATGLQKKKLSPVRLEVHHTCAAAGLLVVKNIRDTSFFGLYKL